jgi:ribonuclease HII
MKPKKAKENGEESKAKDEKREGIIEQNNLSKGSSRMIAGLDEAGRGPVLGPMVMAALTVREDDIKKLEWLGVKDSKLLSAEVREDLFERIREVIQDFRVEVIEPDAIDLSVKGGNSNLNWLEAETSARMINELKPDKLIADCPSVNISSYKNYFFSLLEPEVKAKTELVFEHKADVNHVVVGAASIVAKVIRDRQIEKLIQKVGVDFGSGYTSDPKTQDFLAKYSDKYPEIFRKSWDSYRKVEEGKKQRKLGEF